MYRDMKKSFQFFLQFFFQLVYKEKMKAGRGLLSGNFCSQIEAVAIREI